MSRAVFYRDRLLKVVFGNVVGEVNVKLVEALRKFAAAALPLRGIVGDAVALRGVGIEGVYILI